MYLVIHTGSRNLGKQVAEYYQNLAVELTVGKGDLFKEQSRIIEEYKATGRRREIQGAIQELHKKYKPKELNIPKELCYLIGGYREKYLHDMIICQDYASVNRGVIASILLDKIGLSNEFVEGFETIHNYIDIKSNIVRKGAISAKHGEKLLIPINMRDGCILGVGKGNEDWNTSAPHGAGRIMSRSKAREVVSLDEFKNSMKGIYTTSVGLDTVDESPMAYKSMEEIINNIQDTVVIEKIIKPIYNFKVGE